MANLHIHHEQHNTSQILNILVFSSPFSHVFVYTYLICILFKRSTYLVMVIPFTLLLLFILTSFSSLNLYSFPLLGYVHANNYVYTWMNPEQCVCVCFEKKCFFINKSCPHNAWTGNPQSPSGKLTCYIISMKFINSFQSFTYKHYRQWHQT